MYYALKDKKPVKVDSVLECGIGGDDNHIASDIIQFKGNPVHVSTIFLALDHNFHTSGNPILFETMIFGLLGESEFQRRYTSYEEAECGHKYFCWLLLQGEAPTYDLECNFYREFKIKLEKDAKNLSTKISVKQFQEVFE